MVYATVDTFTLGHGPVAYAVDYCAKAGAALTGYLLNLDANAVPDQTSTDLARQRAFYDLRAETNQANARELLNRTEERKIMAETVTTIDHSRGVVASVADLGRLHDLIITGTNRKGMMSDRVIAEGLLFDTGRPVLIVPQDYDAGFASRTLAVAWDNSAHAARALSDALAYLPDVEDVILLTVGDERAIRNSLDDQQVIDAIARRGISCRLVRLNGNGAPVGQVIQAEAMKLNADMVVMGGFGHSRLRDFVLGGATLSVLEDPLLPLLLSH